MAKLCCSYLHSFGHTPTPGRRSALVFVRPGFLARPALPPAVCRRSGCAGWSRGAPAGYTGSAQPRPVSSAKNLQNKKGVFPRLPTLSFLHKTPPPLSPISKIPPQKQKDPYKGSVFCAILALQALKGRNLQWLKAK